MIVFLAAQLVCVAVVGSATDASAETKWTVEKQHEERVLKEGTPVRIYNHYGDVRVRRMKDERVAAFAIVQMPEKPGTIKPRLMIDDATGLVTVGSPSDTLMAEAMMAPTGDVARVDLTVFIPEHSRVSIETLGGLVQVSGVSKPVSVRTTSGSVKLAVSGDIDVKSRQGPVDILLKSCGRGQDVSVETSTGTVSMRFPRPADARLRAETAGELQTDFSVSVAQPVTSAKKTIKARIAEGPSGPRGFFGRLLKRVTSPMGLVADISIKSSHGDVELYRAAPEWRRPTAKKDRQ